MTVLAPSIPVYPEAPGSTVNWPTAAAFLPQRMTWGVITSRTAWAAAYTGQVQTVLHLADRLRVTLELPPARGAEAADREAFIAAAVSRAHWLRVWHFLRRAPLGTLRGTPTVHGDVAAGARVMQVQTTAGATLRGGDLLGYNGQLMQCAYGGATANGSGVLTMPLVLPLRRGLEDGTALEWDAPTANFQVLEADPSFEFGPAGWQGALTVSLAEVYA